MDNSFGDKRSLQCVFVSHCLLAQGVRANTLAKYEPAMVKPLLQFCMDNDINIMQMPCPETLCIGLGRSPHGKQWYEKHGLREVSKRIAQEQVQYMKTLSDKGFNILAIIGMEFSPACAVTYLNKGRTITRDQGIFVEELKKELKKINLFPKFLGVGMRWMKKLERDLKALK